jgi:dihydroxy-acid dehydratase
VGHVAPEAAARGPIAALRDGDVVTIDVDRRTIRVEVTAGELAERLQYWRPSESVCVRGVMAKYRSLVGSAAEGAVTSPVGAGPAAVGTQTLGGTR